MAEKNFAIYRDTLLAKSGSTALGGGDDEHLPIGLAGSYDCKAALKFTLDWTGVTQITSARLYLKSTTKVHALSWGVSPDLIVERLTASFTENSGRSSYDSPAGGGWSGSASDFDDVGNGVDDVNWTVDTATPNENTWFWVDITGIVDNWAPANVLKSTGGAGGAQSNHGVVVRPVSYTTANSVEFYSRESGSDPYIKLYYTTNTAPNAPTNLSPANGTVVSTVTPTLSWTYTDPQSDNSSKYQVQVSDDITFATTDYDSGEVASVVAHNATQQQATSALTRGVTYYWRAKTWDAAGLVGPWSSTISFTINSLPVGTLLSPNDASGKLAKLAYTAGSNWTTPRMVVEWSYSDAQGQAQSHYELEVITDNAGNPTGTTITSGIVASSASSVTVAGNLAENTRYHVRVRVKDGLEWSAWSGFFICRARWGLTQHHKDMSISGAAPTSWSTLSLNAPTSATQAVTVEYNSADDSGGTNLGAVWQSSLATVTKRKWVRYRVWLFTWGTSPATSPTFQDITIRTSGLVSQPDHWLPNPVSSHKGSIELADRVFGTQSLRMDGDGSAHYISQQLDLEPGEDYILQGRVRSYGNSGAKVYISDTQNGTPLQTPLGANVQTTPLTADAEWTQLLGPVWNSGARSTVWLHTYINGATGTVGLFDGLKMERGRVASPWTPGLVGDGVAIDSGGVQVDASGGSEAIFRLRGSAGGARDIVELGVNGLEFGGDTEVSSPQPLLLAGSDVSGFSRLSFASGGVMSTGAGASTSGYWTKLAHGSLTAQYQDVEVLGHLMGWGDSGGNMHGAFVRFRIKQQAAFGSQPAVAVRVIGDWSADWVGVFVTSAAGPTTWELWARSMTAYQYVRWATLHVAEQYWTAYIPDDNSAMQAGTPSGTAYYGTGDIVRGVTTMEGLSVLGNIGVTGDVSVTATTSAIAVPAWTAVSFQNSWVNYGSTFATCAYYKDAFGIVHLKGLIKDGTLGSAAFTLPTGYRPSASHIFGCHTNATTLPAAKGRVDIASDGTVVPHATHCDNGYLDLSVITFRVA